MPLCIQKPRDPIPRFIAKTRIPDHNPSTCWLWVGSKGRQGYGQFYLDGKLIGAHRASYLLFQGDIPAGQVVMHSCDVRLCVRPAHLSLGTHADNMRDKCLKGRQFPGSYNPEAVEQVYTREPAWLEQALTDTAQLGITACRECGQPVYGRGDRHVSTLVNH